MTKTRLKKAWCEECGYTIRITQKWIEIKAPVCPTCRVLMRHELECEATDSKQLNIWEGKK